MARFENESTSMKFSLTVDGAKNRFGFRKRSERTAITDWAVSR